MHTILITFFCHLSVNWLVSSWDFKQFELRIKCYLLSHFRSQNNASHTVGVQWRMNLSVLPRIWFGVTFFSPLDLSLQGEWSMKKIKRITEKFKNTIWLLPVIRQNGCIKLNRCQKMKIMMIWWFGEKPQWTGNDFPFASCVFTVHKQATKNKLILLIYQIFIEHLLHQELPYPVGSWNAFRCILTFIFLFILICLY